MQVIYNGEPREIALGTTVAHLLEELKVNPLYVAVEVNLDLCPRAQHVQHVLQEGDRVEVVTLVGGG